MRHKKRTIDRHKVRVRLDVNDYQDWLEERGYDAESLENLCSTASPYETGLTLPLLDDAHEVLESLYYNGRLKGRQEQIAGLLLEGFVRVSEGVKLLGAQESIARHLGMRQSNVAVELRKIMKKITENII